MKGVADSCRSDLSPQHNHVQFFYLILIAQILCLRQPTCAFQSERKIKCTVGVFAEISAIL